LPLVGELTALQASVNIGFVPDIPVIPIMETLPIRSV
jgi:hypothetical protein